MGILGIYRWSKNAHLESEIFKYLDICQMKM